MQATAAEEEDVSQRKGTRRWAFKDWEPVAARALEKISDLNRGAATAYVKSLKGRGAKPPTLYGNAQALVKLDQFLAPLGKRFEEATRDDLETFFATLKGERVKGERRIIVDLKENAKSFYRAKIKAFYHRRHRALFEALEMQEWIRARRMYRELTADDILTPDEVKTLIETLDTDRDRALVAVLYDSGTRATEFRSLRIGDVRVMDDGAVDLVLPDGLPGMKTGRRVVTIVESVPYLQRWLDLHPDRKNPKAPLWPAMAKGYTGRPTAENAIRKALVRAARRASPPVTKPVNPHAFRHARATDCARRGWNEETMRLHFGWAPGSDEPSRYVRLANADVRRRVLEDAGRQAKPKPKDSPLAPQRCWFCGTDNPATATFCVQCGRPVSQEKLMEVRRVQRLLEREEEKAALTEEQEQLLKNPLVKKLLQLLGTASPPPRG